jgi:hypothetical protein
MRRFSLRVPETESQKSPSERLRPARAVHATLMRPTRCSRTKRSKRPSARWWPAGAEGKPLRGIAAAKRAKGLKISHERLCRSTQSATRHRVYPLAHFPTPRKVSLRPFSQKISITSSTTAASAGVQHMHIVVQLQALRWLDIPRRPRTRHGGGRCGSPRKFAGAHIKRQRAMCCDSVATRAVSSNQLLKSLRDERRRRPLRRREIGEPAVPNAKRGHDTGPERGPSLHVQGSVWRSCGSSLTLGTQAPDDRMEGFDPFLPFKFGPTTGRNPPRTGRSLVTLRITGRRSSPRRFQGCVRRARH